MTEDTQPGAGHNSIIREQLEAFLQRYERLEAEKKDLMADQREIMAEAKALGYDTKIMRMLLKIRAMDPDQRAEQEAILDLYKQALGMD